MAGGMYDESSGSNADDVVMARWLQSAGLQHLASPYASMQGYGAQSTEEKQRLSKLIRNLTEPYTPSDQNSGGFATSDGFYSPEFRGDFGAGLLDLNAMDDTELLPEYVLSEPFEPSTFMPAVTSAFNSDFDVVNSQSLKSLPDADTTTKISTNDKEISARENNMAKIKVVVRKRPLNKKEITRKEDDIVTVQENALLTVHEPKLKVDLTAYVEKHEFCFDAVLDENVTNDEVYRMTVEPIIPTIFQRTKATCFAYGQTGSGKTYTMQPLPLRAVKDIVRILHQPVYRKEGFRLWLSYFEIYGGKLFDLLSVRKKLCMREDGRQQVCIVGLQEFEVSDVQIVKEFIERGNSARSTGSTGANEESSRSHAILQLVVKKHNEVKESKRNNDGNESRNGKVVGKISFIDLAGSERGADTTDNDRQTRIEGAEINKSLLALKECIRALDNDRLHIPFRGSKLTEVLRDSFVGNSKTVMISCISPSAGSCEHTLNTLRYADRVKSLSKGGNSKEQVASLVPPAVKEVLAAPPSHVSADAGDTYEQLQDFREDTYNKIVENSSYDVCYNLENPPDSYQKNHTFNARQESLATSGGPETMRLEKKAISSGSTGQKAPLTSYTQYSSNAEQKVEKVSPWRKTEKPGLSSTIIKQPMANDSSTSNACYKQNEPESPAYEDHIKDILEEEKALIEAHRTVIEDTMEIVREEMKLLAEVDQRGSLIDNYVTQLSNVLSRKAANLASLQSRLGRFQQRLKQQDILTRKTVPR